MTTHHVRLDFTRQARSADPYALAELLGSTGSTSGEAPTIRYLLRGPDDQLHETAPLSWEPQMLADLAGLSYVGADRRLLAQLSRRLTGLLAPTPWSTIDAEIVGWLRDGHQVIVDFRSDAAELYALPWELLPLGDGRRLGDIEGLLLRYSNRGAPRTVASLSCADAVPGRVLFAWSTKGGRIPTDAHQEALRDALEAVGFSFDPATDVVEDFSLARLVGALAQARDEGRPFAALHILCHGGRTPTGASLMAGNGQPIDPNQFAAALAPYSDCVRLITLCACYSGWSAPLSAAVGSLTQALHRAGFGAVIGARVPLSFDGSTTLTRTLYDRLLPGARSLEQALQDVRRELSITHKDSADRYALQLYARAEDGDDTRPFTIRPYRGLEAFGPEHRDLFFGRDAEADEVVSDLVALIGQGRPRLMVVCGASGTGKSSVVMAGVLPRLLERQPALPGVGDPPRTPESLRARIRDLLLIDPADPELDDLLVDLRALDAPGRRRRKRRPWAWHRVRPGDPTLGEDLSGLDALVEAARKPMLLIVDQFEELFTHVSDPDLRTRFARKLFELSQGESRVCVLLTLRVDFIGRCGELVLDESTGLSLDALAYDERHRVFLPRMSHAQLREAIERPATRVGLHFDEGLIDRILTDAGSSPGALPLLSFCLDQLWLRRKGRTLSHVEYLALGGVGGALKGQADATLASLGPHRSEALSLLVRLVREDPDGVSDTRRRRRLSELRPAEDPEGFDAALEALVDARLVVRGGDEGWLELAHEALIREWQPLRDQLARDRDHLRRIETTHGWVDLWANHDSLLDENRLGFVIELRERLQEESRADLLSLLLDVPAPCGRTARALIAASEAALTERTAALKQALDRAHDLLILSEARRAERDPTLAAMILREVSDPEATEGWASTALRVLAHPLARRILRHDDALSHLAYCPDDRTLLTLSDGVARLWPVSGEAPRVIGGPDAPVTLTAFHPDGALLTVDQEGAVRVHRAGEVERIARLPGAVAAGWAGDRPWVAWPEGLAFIDPATAERQTLDPGPYTLTGAAVHGEGVAGVTREGALLLWREGAPPRVIELSKRPLHLVRLSPDGLLVMAGGFEAAWAMGWAEEAPVRFDHGDGVKVVTLEITPARVCATGDSRGRVRWWNPDGQAVGTHHFHVGYVTALTVLTRGPRAGQQVSAGWDGTAHIDARLGPISRTSRMVQGSRVECAAVSHDQRSLATGGAWGQARVWPVTGAAEPAMLQRNIKRPLALAWSPDGAHLAVALSGQAPALGTADALTPLAGHEGAAGALAFSPSGDALITGGQDRRVMLHRNNSAPTELALHEGEVRCVAWSPDGRRVLSGSDDGTVLLSSVDGTAPSKLEGHYDSVLSARFSPDGAQAITRSADGSARIWTLATGTSDEARFTDVPIRDIGFAADGSALLVAGDGSLWRVRDGEPACLQPAWTEAVEDGDLCVGGGCALLMLSDAVVCRPLGPGDPTRFAPPTGARPFHAVLSPSGSRLFIADVNQKGWVFDTRHPERPPLELPEPCEPQASAFSPDGTRLLTAGEGLDAVLWTVDPARLMALLKERVQAELTEAERRTWGLG
ncbi:MAG: CHAT domain-containing protein [Alphaproteobacteria bacterium]|nr:CHAT domain-containing protein [Alphaproteobacteria bacterium]